MRRVRIIRCANYTAVRENGSISARTTTNGANLIVPITYSIDSYSTLFFAASGGGILHTGEDRVAVNASTMVNSFPPGREASLVDE